MNLLSLKLDKITGEVNNEKYKWILNSNYELGVYDEDIFRAVVKDGLYFNSRFYPYENKLREGFFLVIDLDYDNIINDSEIRNSFLFKTVEALMREEKINKILGEI